MKKIEGGKKDTYFIYNKKMDIPCFTGFALMQLKQLCKDKCCHGRINR